MSESDRCKCGVAVADFVQSLAIWTDWVEALDKAVKGFPKTPKDSEIPAIMKNSLNWWIPIIEEKCKIPVSRTGEDLVNRAVEELRDDKPYRALENLEQLRAYISKSLETCARE